MLLLAVTHTTSQDGFSEVADKLVNYATKPKRGKSTSILLKMQEGDGARHEMYC